MFYQQCRGCDHCFAVFISPYILTSTNATALPIVRSLVAILIPIRSNLIFVCVVFAATLCMMLSMMLSRLKDYDASEVHIVGIGRKAAE